MKTGQSEERTPAFFKVYLPTSAKKIQIPTAYAIHMKGDIPKRSFLRHQEEKVWPVLVEKIGNDFFFVDGWENYVEDNSLEAGDFLVFQYDGGRLYDVTLLGRHGTAKGLVEVDEELEEEEEEEEDLMTKAYKGKRKRVEANAHDHDIFKSGLISRPNNPYFLTSLRKERRNELFVPLDFIQDNNLRLSTVITLRDEDGRNWDSKLKVWKDGRVWYYRGWGRLCRVNRVAENDICICELKKGTDGLEFFQVYIVREEIVNAEK